MSFPNNIAVFDHSENIATYLTDLLESNAEEDINLLTLDDARFDQKETLSGAVVLIEISPENAQRSLAFARNIGRDAKAAVIFICSEYNRELQAKIVEMIPYGVLFKPYTPKQLSIAIQLAYSNYLRDRDRLQIQTERKRSKVIEISELYRYDFEKEILYYRDEAIHLDPRQRRAIDCLCRNINRTVSYLSLSCAIWGEERNGGSVLRTLIYTLRKKLPDFPLFSCPKEGYILKCLR
jgi:DNA-binding response OmpR family regulator